MIIIIDAIYSIRSWVPVEIFSVEVKVFMDKSRNIPETMVISWSCFIYVLVVCLYQLISQVLNVYSIFELVVSGIVDEERGFMIISTFYYFSGIVFFSLFLRFFKKELISLCSPLAFSRITDRSKSRNWSIFSSF